MRTQKLLDHLRRYQLEAMIGVADQLTLPILPEAILPTVLILRDAEDLAFDMLIDVCGVDYLHYGVSNWDTETTTTTGFSRAVHDLKPPTQMKRPRFAVVYHLLSLTHNWRLRLQVFLEDDSLSIDSVVSVWPAANWFEREAFDLFGIQFKGHPDLRRILTDYGFIGHPFRKDFPLEGNVEIRYDATLGKCVYEENTVKKRVLVPKVIRHDARCLAETGVDVGMDSEEGQGGA